MTAAHSQYPEGVYSLMLASSLRMATPFLVTIFRRSTLDFVLCLYSGMQIFVKTLMEMITLKVESSDRMTI